VLGCIILSALGTVAYLFTASQTQITNKVPLPSSPEVLVKEARDLLETIGYTKEPGDRTWGFWLSSGNLRALSARYDRSEHARLLAEGWPAIDFWYRESPSPSSASDG